MVVTLQLARFLASAVSGECNTEQRVRCAVMQQHANVVVAAGAALSVCDCDLCYAVHERDTFRKRRRKDDSSLHRTSRR